MVSDAWFRSTLPRGSDLAQMAEHYLDLDVSIHAPAWRATAPDITDFCASRNPGRCANQAVSDVRRLRFSQRNFKNVIFFRNMAVARTCRENLARLRFARRARSAQRLWRCASCTATGRLDGSARGTIRNGQSGLTTHLAWPAGFIGTAPFSQPASARRRAAPAHLEKVCQRVRRAGCRPRARQFVVIDMRQDKRNYALERRRIRCLDARHFVIQMSARAIGPPLFVIVFLVKYYAIKDFT